MLPLLPFLGLELPSYTVLILCGFGIGLYTAEHRRFLYHLRRDVVLAGCFLGGIGAFLGGKTFYILQGLPDYLERAATENLTFIEYFTNAGLVFYGGMFGCLAFFVLAAHALRESTWAMLDTLLPSLPLAQAFGRIGCFLSGCCYGLPCSWGIPAEPLGLPRFPVQLMESAGAFIIYMLLSRLSSTKRRPGFLLGIYLTSYGLLRFCLEFLRGDAVRGFIGLLSVSQWISIAVLAFGLLCLCWQHRIRSARTA